MNLYHFSQKPLPVETLLVGMKAINKKQQRVGQQRVDEDFEEIRKSQFPIAPSLFTSLWTANIFDLSIPRKAFEENPDVPFGYFTKWNLRETFTKSNRIGKYSPAAL